MVGVGKMNFKNPQVHIPRAWAKAMTTSWHVVSSVTPQTTRETPSTNTLTSIVAKLNKPKRGDNSKC